MDLSKVRVKENIGIVANDTNTGNFNFLISPLKNRANSVKGDYVLIDHPTLGEACQVLALIKEVKSYEEIAGGSIAERTGRNLATVEVIGYVDIREENRPLRKLLESPTPGNRVYLPLAEFLEDTFARDVNGKTFEKQLHIGKVESYANCNELCRTLNFCLNSQDLKKHHWLISAMTGAGKTHTAIVIAEELANKTDQKVVILDAHGEYSTVGIAEKERQTDNPEKAIQEYPFSFPVLIYTSDTEKMMKNLFAHDPTKVDSKRFIVRAIPTDWNKSQNEGTALDTTQTQALENAKKSSSRIMVIDGKDFSSEEKQRIFTNTVKTLWNLRADEKAEPFILIVEDPKTLEGELLEQIATEGEKIGITLILISQHPTEISRKILSQMSNQILGRTVDLEDLEYLKNMTLEASHFLPRLAVGEWIVNGITARGPERVLIRERYSVGVQ